MEVVARVGHAQAYRAGVAGVGDAERLDLGAGHRDARRWRDGFGAGALDTRDLRVDRQVRERGQLRYGQQVAAAETPGPEGLSWAAKADAVEVVVLGVGGEARGESVRAASGGVA